MEPSTPPGAIEAALGGDEGETAEAVAETGGEPGDDDTGLTAYAVVHDAISNSVSRLIQHEAGSAAGGQPEAIHQARVSTRRLRSDLRTFGSLFDPAWVAATGEELRWLGHELGLARDRGVLLERLQASARQLPDSDDRAGARLLSRLLEEVREAEAGISVALSSDRYLLLRDRLVEAVQEPPLLAQAKAPAQAVLAPIARRPWKKLARAVAAAGNHPSDDELHDIRIRAKRLRYATEAVTPAFGRRARQMAEAAARLQTVLGDHQDAIVTQDWLREASRRRSPAEAFFAGRLMALQEDLAAAARSAWPKAWREISRKRLRGWLLEPFEVA